MSALKPTQAEYDAACLVIADFHYPLFTYVATREIEDDNAGELIVPTLDGRENADGIDFIEDGGTPTADPEFVGERKTAE